MARRGWSKGSLFMGASGPDSLAIGGDRSLTVASLIGAHTCKPSRDRQGAFCHCMVRASGVSLHPRDGPFQAGDEVQFRRRESEHFLVLAIECIAQLAVGGHAASDSVIQVDAGVGEAGIPE